MKRTIEDLTEIVEKSFTFKVTYEDGAPRYVFVDKQTGATTSCNYNKDDYNQTVSELLYA